MPAKKKSSNSSLWLLILFAASVFTFLVRRSFTGGPLCSAAIAVLGTLVFTLLARSVLYDDKKMLFAGIVLLTMHGFLVLGRSSDYIPMALGVLMALAAGLFYIVAFGGKSKGSSGLLILGGVTAGASFCVGGFPTLAGIVLPLLLAYLLVWRPSLKGRIWTLLLSFVAGFGIFVLYGVWLYYFEGLSFKNILSLRAFAPASLSWNSLVSMARSLGVWTVPAVVALLAPLFSAPERSSVEYRFFAVWMLFALVATPFFPFAAGGASSVAILFPAALMIGYTSLRWDGTTSKKGDTIGVMNAVNAVALSAAVLFLSVRLWYYHSAVLSVATIGILGVSAVAVAVYIFSSIFRRGASDNVVGIGLFALITEILLQPALWLL